MAAPHSQPGDLIDLRALETELATARTQVIAKADDFEIIRLVLRQGKDIPSHRTAGRLIVQCLQGRVKFIAMGSELELRPGHMFYLPPGEPHALTALEDSSLLLTILAASQP